MEGCEHWGMFISDTGTFAIKLDLVETSASLKVLHHVSETNVGQSVATHDPQLDGLEAIWKRSSKVLKPLISDLLAPSKVDVEFSQSLLLRESGQETFEDLQIDVLVLIKDKGDILKMVMEGHTVGKSFHLLSRDLFGHVKVDTLRFLLDFVQVITSHTRADEVNVVHLGHDGEVLMVVLMVLRIDFVIVESQPSIFICFHINLDNIDVTFHDASLDNILNSSSIGNGDFLNGDSTGGDSHSLVDHFTGLTLLSLEGVLVGR